MKTTPNFEGFQIRKWHTHIEDVLTNENGRHADGEPLRKIVIAAVILNPFAGRGVEDLSEVVNASPALGHEFARRIRQLLGDDKVESYGKACVVGADGEYEHGNAFLTSVFADPVRDAVGGGKAWVPSTGKRGGINTVIDIPLAHKDALYVRSHYDTVSVMCPDAPNRDEVVIAFAFASRGRLHARLGGIKASEIRGQDGLQ
ncbi:MAG TPA: amino acid synthesis family protein [Paraburkholderia sp.]